MTRSILEPARHVDVIHETEVLVVGSGPGDLTAALASARAGAQTTLLERYGCFGGNITQVRVEGFAWYRHPATIDSEGIGLEFEDGAKAMGAAIPEPQSISDALDAEAFKYVADVLIEEAGVDPMLHRMFVAPIVERGEIKGVIVESKAGCEAILAKRVVDATGDADIVARCGAPTFTTPKAEMMSVSVMFLLFLRNPFRKALEAGLLPDNLATSAGTRGTVSDQGDLTYLNMVHMTLDGTDPDDLTKGEMGGASRRCSRSRRSSGSCRGARPPSCAISE